jgi:hypothetical protein
MLAFNCEWKRQSRREYTALDHPVKSVPIQIGPKSNRPQNESHTGPKE